jgi:KipI family sensor histidine kinase inhibitor
LQRNLRMVTSAVEGARFQGVSDQSLMVYFGEHISVPVHDRVVRLLRLLEMQPIAGVRNLHPAYCSLLVKFDVLRWTHGALEIVLREYLGRLESVPLAAPREIEIPVCYGGEFGPDIDEVCAFHGMTVEQIIAAHIATSYLAYFLGFVPGFAYLGPTSDGGTERAAGRKGKRPALQGIPSTPRLAVPRRVVPAGSVGIAGAQTGVYPFATPGGWRLIGRTPMKMFLAEPDARAVLSIGDRVRFVAISAARFEEMVEA